jgi:hypothetical protein
MTRKHAKRSQTQKPVVLTAETRRAINNSVFAFQGEPVISLPQMSRLHSRAANAAGQAFRRHKDKLIEGRHYFVVKHAELQALLETLKLNVSNGNKDKNEAQKADAQELIETLRLSVSIGDSDKSASLDAEASSRLETLKLNVSRRDVDQNDLQNADAQEFIETIGLSVSSGDHGGYRGEAILLTKRGYLLLVKSFNDALAWQVQDMLVDAFERLEAIRGGGVAAPSPSPEKVPAEFIEAVTELRREIAAVQSSVATVRESVSGAVATVRESVAEKAAAHREAMLAEFAQAREVFGREHMTTREAVSAEAAASREAMLARFAQAENFHLDQNKHQFFRLWNVVAEELVKLQKAWRGDARAILEEIAQRIDRAFRQFEETHFPAPSESLPPQQLLQPQSRESRADAAGASSGAAERVAGDQDRRRVAVWWDSFGETKRRAGEIAALAGGSLVEGSSALSKSMRLAHWIDRMVKAQSVFVLGKDGPRLRICSQQLFHASGPRLYWLQPVAK